MSKHEKFKCKSFDWNMDEMKKDINLILIGRLKTINVKGSIGLGCEKYYK